MYTVKGAFGNVLMRFFSLLPLRNEVIFSSFDGQSSGDNPRLIYEEMRKKYPDLKYTWFLYNPDTNIEGAEVIKAYSVKALYHQSVSKLWIFNSRQREWIHKRKDQFYVQTWHGDVCIKKIEADASNQLGEYYMREAKHDSEMADLMISGSDFRTNNYKTAFMYDGEILEFGTPKSVVYYESPVIHRTKVLDYYKLADDVKIALYCPTFRNNGDIDVYNLDYDLLRSALMERWPGNWVIIVRLHPKLQKFQNQIKYSDTTLNGSAYLSTDELIISSELLVTDYSGCMFQGLEANKKVVLYTPDLDEYIKNERDLYFDIQKLPFPIIKSNSKIHDVILNFDESKYAQETRILKSQIGYKTTIDSTQRVVDHIFNKVWRCDK